LLGPLIFHLSGSHRYDFDVTDVQPGGASRLKPTVDAVQLRGGDEFIEQLRSIVTTAAMLWVCPIGYA